MNEELDLPSVHADRPELRPEDVVGAPPASTDVRPPLHRLAGLLGAAASTGPRNRHRRVDLETAEDASGLEPYVTTLAISDALDDVSSHEGPPSGIRICNEENVVFDEDAFTAFAAQQANPRSVRRFARTFHVPKDVAADITQEALLSLWRHRENVASSRWSGWFHRTMLRGALSYSRAIRRARKYETAIVYEVYETRPVAPPDVELHLQECEHELLRLIDLLRPERRDVVKRYLLDELPMKEVAEQLGIPEDTAKNRWRLAQLDMSRAFRRERAKERFLALVAAFIAFFVALWRRVVGRGSRRIGPLLACAALALVVVSHDGGPALAAASQTDEEEARIELSSSRFEYTFTPKLMAFAEREMDRPAPPLHVNEAQIEVALVLLAQAAAALRDDRKAVARTYLAQYRAAFPRDPAERFALQYLAISAELGR